MRIRPRRKTPKGSPPQSEPMRKRSTSRRPRSNQSKSMSCKNDAERHDCPHAFRTGTGQASASGDAQFHPPGRAARHPSTHRRLAVDVIDRAFADVVLAGIARRPRTPGGRCDMATPDQRACAVRWVVRCRRGTSPVRSRCSAATSVRSPAARGPRCAGHFPQRCALGAGLAGAAAVVVRCRWPRVGFARIHAAGIPGRRRERRPNWRRDKAHRSHCSCMSRTPTWSHSPSTFVNRSRFANKGVHARKSRARLPSPPKAVIRTTGLLSEFRRGTSLRECRRSP